MRGNRDKRGNRGNRAYRLREKPIKAETHEGGEENRVGEERESRWKNDAEAEQQFGKRINGGDCEIEKDREAEGVGGKCGGDVAMHDVRETRGKPARGAWAV